MYFTDYCNPSVLKPVHCYPWYARYCTSVVPIQRICLCTPWFPLLRQWSLYVDCSCSCYLIVLDSIDISISSKGKAPVSTYDIEAFIKEQLAIEIQRLSAANVQLVTNKIETKRAKVNLKADRMRLLGEKNSLIVKRKEFRTEIVIMNAVKSFNVSIRSHQNPLLEPTRDKLKAKRPPLFNNIKENFQEFFIRTRYY